MNKSIHIVRHDGSQEPFTSLEAAFSSVVDGETILLTGSHQITPTLGPGANGTYTTPLRLEGKRHIRISGCAGAEIIGNGPGDFMAIKDCEDITINFLQFKSDRPKVGEVLYAMILLRGANDGIRITNCGFEGFGDHGISHLWPPKTSKNITIRDCVFRNGGAMGVPNLGGDGAAISGIGSGWWIHNNLVEHCLRGFEIENSGHNVIEGIDITFNTLNHIDDLGVMLFATNKDGAKFRDINISGNRFAFFDNPDPAVSATAIRLSAGTGINIANNYLEAIKRQGIVVTSTNGEARNITIAGNCIYNVGNNGIAVREDTAPCKNVLITGNTVTETGEFAILMRGVDVGCISNNICRDNGLYTKCGSMISEGEHSDTINVYGNRVD